MGQDAAVFFQLVPPFGAAQRSLFLNARGATSQIQCERQINQALLAERVHHIT